MIISTRHFGEIEIDEEKILSFDDGLPGFDSVKEYIIIHNPDPEFPFQWLQSVKNGDVAFVITNPFLFKPDYDFEISENIISKLEITDHKDVVIYTIVVVPEDIKKMTTNLMAPIIVNLNNKKAKQVILEVNKYSLKHYIFESQAKTSIDEEIKQESAGEGL